MLYLCQRKKRLLGGRVSSETYNYVMSLIKSDNPAFESTTEYIQTLIISDIAMRKNNDKVSIDKFKQILNDSEIRDIIKDIIKEVLTESKN